MRSMFSPRRHILATVVLSLFFLSLVSGCVAWYVLQESWISPLYFLWAILFLMFFIPTCFFYFKIHRPLQKITHEMKALLTGKNYRRILTSKTNELGLLAHFFNEVTRNLESISSDVQTHKRLQKELNSAQEIQQMLIPKTAPLIPNLEITAKTRPASEIGGDTFDFFQIHERNFLYIGDSTGHGIPAGIVMVMVDVLLETFLSIENRLTDILIKLNQYLKPHLKPSMFMTMILLEWLPKEHALKWVGAGHEHLLHIHAKDGHVDGIKAGGLAVGMLADNRPFIEEKTLSLAEGDFVVLYSDGIIEAKNIHGEIYGLPRLKTFLEGHAAANLSTQDLFERIAIDVGQFMQGYPQLDDMTLIVMKHVQGGLQYTRESTDWSPS